MYLLLFCGMLLLVLIDRWRLLDQFTFRYVCDDQAIAWAATKDYSEGKFLEPFFYGQPYNPMPENFLALLMTKSGVAYNKAIPIAVSVLSLFPFILLGVLLMRRQKVMQALMVTSLPLLLPHQYSMIASMGSISGVFFAGLSSVALFTESKFRFALFGIMSALALFINPNSGIIVFPVGLLLLMENFRNLKFYYQTILGAIPGLIIWFYANQFYVWHPEYVVHGKWKLEFSLLIIKPYEWDKFFNYVTPVLRNVGWIIIPSFLILAFVLFRQNNKRAATAACSAAALIFLSTTILKVHDGTHSVFYSWSRMFMGVPVLLALFFALMKFSNVRTGIIIAIAGTGLLFFGIKWFTLDDVVTDEIITKEKEHNMYVAEVSALQKLCDSLSAIAISNKVELVVVGDHFTKHVVNYGCPCMVDSFPPSIEPSRDRRTWLLKEEESQVRKVVLFAEYYEDLLPERMKNYRGMQRIPGDPAIWLLDSNQIATGALLDSLGIPMRSH